MSLDLVYKRLTFLRKPVANRSESVIEGSVTLPDGYPEIGRTVRLDARPRVTDVEVKEGRVIFEGALDLSLIYSHFEERRLPSGDDDEFDEEEEDARPRGRREPEVVVEEHLRRAAWSGGVPFVYLLELPGVAEGQDVSTDVKVRRADGEVRSDQRTVDVDVALEFRAWVGKVDEARVVTGVRGGDGVETQTRSLRIRDHLGEGEAEVEAGGDLSLTGRAVPQTVLEMEADPSVTEAFVDDGSVRVRGNVAYTAFYVGAEGAGPQYAEWPRGASFELELPVAGARRGAQAAVRVEPGRTTSRLVEDEDGRVLQVRTPLAVRVAVHETGNVPIVVGIESDEREIAVRTEALNLVEAVGEGRASDEAETALNLPEGLPGIDRILFGEAKAEVDDVHVLGDKVAVEMHVDVDLTYVGRSEGEGGVYVASWPKAVSMDLEIPLDGAEPGLEREVTVDVDRIDLDLVNRETVDARIGVTGAAELSREVQLDAVVEAVEVPPAEEHPPTYTFVVAEPSDSVWKLAARYRSRPELIVEANDWLESASSELPAGKKVCVPRKVQPPVA